jgi:hypothetical protein
MTRINCGVNADELPDKILLAELREIKRIPNAIRNGRYSLNGIPEEFTLGTGHVKFFYDKLEYLYERYQALRSEALDRGFNVSDFSEAWDGVPQELMNGYIEKIRDREIIISRIQERGFDLLEK